MRWLIQPICSSRVLMTPNWSFNIQPHILAETMVGMAQGTSTMVRTKARPLNSRLSNMATPKPVRVSSSTETVAKQKVLRIEIPQSLAQKPSSSLGLKNSPYSPT